MTSGPIVATVACVVCGRTHPDRDQCGSEMARKVADVLAEKRGILLDVSMGGEPQARSVTLREMGASPLTVPWPLPDACVHTAVVTHVLEYLEPAVVFAWWDELWRVMQPQGIVYCSGPYGGDESWAWASDPLHRVRVIEQTFLWLDARTENWKTLHGTVGREQPKPWHVHLCNRVPAFNGSVGYNTTLQKVVL